MSKALDLIDRARDNCEDIAVHLLGAPNKALSSPVAIKWGDTGKLTLTVSGGQAGKWRDWASGDYGDAMDLIKRELALDQSGALAWLDQWFGGTAPMVDHEARAAQRAVVDEKEAVRKRAKRQAASNLWRSAVPLSGSLAERYLGDRLTGLPIPAAVYEGGALRWSTQATNFAGRTVAGCAGAMLALMTDPATNKPTGIHRTFLDANGKKLERRMLGDKGVVRLWGDDAVHAGLSIAEGIETTLSAAVLLDAAPAWAALDAGNIALFPVLDGIEALAIYADNDLEKKGRRAGQDAAQACAARWLGQGREVTIRTPRAAEADFNDMLVNLAGKGVAA